MYIGTDGNYYLNTTGGTAPDVVYAMKDNNFYVQKELQQADYKNFEAMKNAMTTDASVVANVSVIAPSRNINYMTMSGLRNYIADEEVPGTTGFIDIVNRYYEQDDSETLTQGSIANNIFATYGSANTTSANVPFFVMSAGEFRYGTQANETTSVLEATFENYAPAIEGYDNLEHNFMTVVAVKHEKGTADADSIAVYGNGVGDDYGRLTLSKWTDANGTLADTSDDVTYMSRKCGKLTLNGIDPWCFAAAGATAEMATASAAGAVASLKAAFSYMSNRQLYYLLALTADGYLMKSDGKGNTYNTETLAEYLKNMYALPSEYNADNLSAEKYLDAFQEVYGYGLINLERATMPNRKIYVYDGDNIVSADGNAYWGATTRTAFKPSSVLNLRGATISAPFFDVVESLDGSVSLPRVWENKFAIGSDNRRGLYMGDVLGGLTTRRDNAQQTQIGDMCFSM